MYKNIKKSPYFLTILAIIAAALVIFGVRYMIEVRAFRKISDNLAVDITSSLNERGASIDSVRQYGDVTNTVLLQTAASVYHGTDFDHLSMLDFYTKLGEFLDIFEDSDISELYFVSPGGKIYFSTDLNLIGKSIVVSGIVTQDQFDKLKNSAEELDNRKIGSESRYLDEKFEPVKVKREEGNVNLYCTTVSDSSFGGNNYIIGGSTGKVEESIAAMLSDFTVYYSFTNGCNGISSFMVDSDTGIITYAGREMKDLIGEKAADHGITPELFTDGKEEHDIRLDGQKLKMRSISYSSPNFGNFQICVTYSGIDRGTVIRLLAVIFLIGAIALTALTTGLVIRHDPSFRNKSHKEALAETNRRIIGLGVFAVALSVVFCFYIITVDGINDTMDRAENSSIQLAEAAAKNADLAAEAEKYFEQRKLSIARSTREYVEHNENYTFASYLDENEKIYMQPDKNGVSAPVPDVLGNPTVSIMNDGILSMTCLNGNFESAFILDSNGRTIATSGPDWYFDINSGISGHDQEYNDVLQRRREYYYDVAVNSDGTSREAGMAVPLDLFISSENGKTVYHSKEEFENDETGEIRRSYGLLVIRSRNDEAVLMGSDAAMISTMSSIKAVEGCELAVIDPEAEKKVMRSTCALTESEYESIGYNATEVADMGFRSAVIDGKDVLTCIIAIPPTTGAGYLKGKSCLLLNPESTVYSGRGDTVKTVSICTVFLMIIVWLIVISYLSKMPVPSPEQEKTALEQKKEEYENRAIAKANSRPSGGAGIFLKIILGIIALVLVLMSIRSLAGNPVSSFFDYMISRRWERGMNIFSVSYVIFLMIIITTALNAARKVVGAVSSSISPAAETVIRLILSVVQYTGILVLIFYSVQLFGVQTGTVITFGGIITGVIGLGANSLISDIIAGLFIIFEREFKVGDIVTIDNFTGVVRQIGLRTTRVQDSGGNVKTFNNSKIYGVLNLTENYSTAFVAVNVSVDEPVEKVETLVNTELPKRMADDPDIVEGPWFSGIVNIDKGYYKISVGARCLQQNQWTVQKDVYKYLLALLNENNIKIS